MSFKLTSNGYQQVKRLVDTHFYIARRTFQYDMGIEVLQNGIIPMFFRYAGYRANEMIGDTQYGKIRQVKREKMGSRQ